MGDFWLKCDSCNRENIGVTFVNGMRFCAKCYQETFGNTNPFYENDLRNKIADLEAKLAEKEAQLKDAIIPKFKIGQKVYMIPNKFNGLKGLTEYEVMDYTLCSLGIRFHLSIIEKQKGIEQFYCASEDMIGISIFSNKEEALLKHSNSGELK